jgi:aspartyl protease family protein
MRPLLIACAAIALAAVCAPSVLPMLLARARPAATTAPPRLNASRGLDTAQVAASSDGHFYLEAEVNRESVRFIVDTGASAVVLRESDAENAGLRIGRGDFTHRVTTANGATKAAQVTLGSIAVGDVEVRNTEALVIPDDQLGISLLGATFLNKLKRYEVADGNLVMEN